MTSIRIPPTLRAEAGGERQVEVSGDSVRELLEDLTSRFPALHDRIWEDGQVADFVNVYLDGEDIRTLEGVETPVREGATLILLPAMAGGSTAPLAGAASRPAKGVAALPPLPLRLLRKRVRFRAFGGPSRQERGGAS